MVERVAQSVEHLPFKQEVLGSIPSTLTTPQVAEERPPALLHSAALTAAHDQCASLLRPSRASHSDALDRPGV